MLRRRLCLLVAAPFLIVVGCGGKKEEALRLFEIKHSRYGCVIREGSNEPYADACDQKYSVAKKDKETELVAMIPSGVCYMRPADCTKVDCLQAEVPCPPGPDKAMPPKSGQWKVEKTDTECRVTPKPPTYKNARIAPYDMPCPDYPEGTVGVRRGLGENRSRCQVDDGFECALDDSTCTPPPAVYVACPPK
ncbi:MAG: hypothetical protein H0T42_33385 [Deltaproteobacteria bacterium]|nr:hypothetical protein [Deltaproteobacteria bacterium]